MRTLKVLTVVLALSSAVAFVLASRATARPLTAISAVQPSMNYAYVRIEGRVPDFPNLTDGALSFRVLDQSGEMRVVAYRSVVDGLTAAKRIPMPGDLVIIEGTLRIRDEEPSLIVNAPEALMIQSQANDVAPIRLAALDAMQVGERAQVTGQVRRVRAVNESLKIVTLREGNATVDIVLPLNLPVFAGVPALAEGEWIRVIGGVGEFRGTKQVLPLGAAAIERVPKPKADDVRPIGALDKSLVGQWVGLRGTVTDLRSFSQGMRIVLRDDAGAEMIAVIFDHAWQAMPISQTLSVGDAVRVDGELQEYRGALEILPELAVDVSIVE